MVDVGVLGKDLGERNNNVTMLTVGSDMESGQVMVIKNAVCFGGGQVTHFLRTCGIPCLHPCVAVQCHLDLQE